MLSSRRINLLLMVMFTVLTTGEILPATTQATVIKVGGTGAGLGTIGVLATAFEKSHPDAKIKVVPSLGSSGGIKAVLSGALDIAICSRPLKQEEKRAGLIISEYARTPFVFAVHRKVNRDSVTTLELVEIYAGRIVNWPDGTRVRLVTRPESETDTAIVRGLSPAMDLAVKSAISREGMILATTDQDNADALEKTPGALGGCTLAQVISEKRDVKVLTFDGVKPGVKTLRNGSYRLLKPLFLVTTIKTSAAARRFAEYIRSSEGRAILTKNGNLAIEAK